MPRLPAQQHSAKPGAYSPDSERLTPPGPSDHSDEVWLPGPVTEPRAKARSTPYTRGFLIDMAAGMASEAEVCADHGIAWLDWLAIKITPAWRQALAEHRKRVQTVATQTGTSAPKPLTYREACSELRDSLLPNMADIVTDSHNSPAVRVDAFKAIAAGADDGSSKASNVPTFNLQINFSQPAAHASAMTSVAIERLPE